MLKLLIVNAIPLIIGALGALVLEHGPRWLIDKVKSIRAQAGTQVTGTFAEVQSQVDAAVGSKMKDIGVVVEQVKGVLARIGALETAVADLKKKLP